MRRMHEAALLLTRWSAGAILLGLLILTWLSGRLARRGLDGRGCSCRLSVSFCPDGSLIALYKVGRSSALYKIGTLGLRVDLYEHRPGDPEAQAEDGFRKAMTVEHATKVAVLSYLGRRGFAVGLDDERWCCERIDHQQGADGASASILELRNEELDRTATFELRAEGQWKRVSLSVLEFSHALSQGSLQTAKLTRRQSRQLLTVLLRSSFEYVGNRCDRVSYR